MSKRIRCRDTKKIIYNYLNGAEKDVTKDDYNYPESFPENVGPLKDVKHSTLFMLSFALGFNNQSTEKTNPYEFLANPDSFDNYVLPLIKAIAIYESDEGIDVLHEDEEYFYEFAQEYANAGVDLLNEKYQNNMMNIIDDFHMEIDKMIVDKHVFKKVSDLQK